MLSGFSWSLFFSAAGLLALAYYLLIILVFYPREILGLLFGKAKPLPQPAAMVQAKDIIGQVRSETAPSVHSRYTPIPATFPADTLPDAQPDISLIGTVADLTHAIDTLLRVIADSEGDGRDVLTLMPGLLQQYAPVTNSKYRYAVNALIRERCSALLSLELDITDIDALWTA